MRMNPITSSAVAARIVHLIDSLAGLPSLAPSPAVDGLFGELVTTVLAAPEDDAGDVLADPGVRGRRALLHDLSARGEAERERSWATRIRDAADPHAELAAFPYVGNYERLARLELGVVNRHATAPVRSVAVLGSGPLPLTALAWASALSVPVTGVDSDPFATSLAESVTLALEAPHVRFETADARDTDLAGYDLVFLAALVGATPTEKAEIAARVRSTMRPGSLLLARTARGLRTLLYPPVDTGALAGFDVLEIAHPTENVVNSVVLARAA